MFKSCKRCKCNMCHSLWQEDHIFLDSEVTFPTLSALIEHYHNHPLPHHGSLCLQKPYTNPLSSWPPPSTYANTSGSNEEQRAGDVFCNWNPPLSKTSGNEPTHRLNPPQVEWLSPQTGTDGTSRCGKENCGCTRMLHEDCYFVCNLYQTKSISDRHLVEHYWTHSKTN